MHHIQKYSDNASYRQCLMCPGQVDGDDVSGIGSCPCHYLLVVHILIQTGFYNMWQINAANDLDWIRQE